jgi:hypothetical protein
MFSAVGRVSGSLFMFCALGLVFGDTGGVRSRFHVLRARIHFRRYRRHPLPFSCFALTNTFSVVRTGSFPVFTFCVPELMFNGTYGVVFRFHILRSWTRLRRLRGRGVPFSCFAIPDSFSAVLRASRLVFMFCAPGHVFGSSEGVGSRFQILRSRTRYGGTEGIGTHFHVLRSRIRFRRLRGRRVPFSCIASPYSFSAVPRASGLVLMFCAPELIFDGSEGVKSRFYVLRTHTRFRR